jgi:hypothetical protein
VHWTYARPTEHAPEPASFKLAGHRHVEGAPLWTSDVMAAPSVAPTPLLALLHPAAAISRATAPNVTAIVLRLTRQP